MSKKSDSREENQLGLNASITRRDFVGSTLIGVGSALLGMTAPSFAKNTDLNQRITLPLTGLDQKWTGPGGIGDYGDANGNTHRVVNAGHAIRNQELVAQLGEARDSGEIYELVVVGAGFAGLTAAYNYHQERPSDSCLILDNHDVFGGNAKQNEFEVDGVHLWAPQASAGNAWPPDVVDRLGISVRYWKEFGFPEDVEWQEATGLDKHIQIDKDGWSPMNIAPERADTGYFFENGKNKKNEWVINPWNNAFEDTPYSQKYRRDLMVAELFRMPPHVEDVGAYLDSMTYLEYLTNVVGVSPEYAKHVTKPMAAMGTGLGADVVSAYTAKGFFQPATAGFDLRKGQYDVSDTICVAGLPGGNCGIARHFVKALIPDVFPGAKTVSDVVLNKTINWSALDNPGQPVRMRLNATVIDVQHEGDSDSSKHVNVTYLIGTQLHKVRAKRVVMASEQHVNKHIVKGLPQRTFDAMDSFMHAPMLSVNVAVRHWQYMEKLGISAARWDEGFGWWLAIRRQMILDGKEPMPLDPSKPIVLTFWMPFPVPGLPVAEQAVASRMQMFGLTYRDIEMGVRKQLTKMFAPYGFDAKRDIAGITANRWGHAYVVTPPGFHHGHNGQPSNSDVIRQGFGRIQFAHSELFGEQLWQTAALEGERAAKEVLKL